MNKQEFLEALRALDPNELLALFGPRGRTERQGPLTDLRIAPSAHEARPLFPAFEDSQKPQIPYVYRPYPKLLWHVETGREITVKDEAAHQSLGAKWSSTPPNHVPVSASQQVRDELEGLSDEDRAIVQEARRQARLDKIHRLMAQISDEEGDALMGELPVIIGEPVAVVAEAVPAKVDKRTKAYKQSQG